MNDLFLNNLVKIISDEIIKYDYTKQNKKDIHNWQSVSESYYDLGGELKILTGVFDLKNIDIIIGKFKKEEGLKKHYHKYPTEEIYYIIEGEGEINIDGEILIAKKGDLLSIKPEVPHFPINRQDKLLWVLFILSPIEKSPPVILE